MSCARSYIARLFGLCLLCSGLAARSETITNDVNSIKRDIDSIEQMLSNMYISWPPNSGDIASILSILNGASLGGNLNTIANALAYGESIGHNDTVLERQRAIVKFLTGNDYNSSQLGSSRQRSLPDLFYELEGVIQNTAFNPTVIVTNQAVFNTVITNIIQGGGGSPDYLAGNPWWATNSQFILNDAYLADAYPMDPAELPRYYSFPEFLSAWATRLNNPLAQASASAINQNWFSWWGHDSIRDWTQPSSSGLRYTWYDWVADIMRSNLQAQASYHDRLLSSGSDDADYIVNHLDSGIDDITNLLARLVSGSSSLQGENPWWYTNSHFSAYSHQVANMTPSPWDPVGGGIGLGGNYSFPQLYSFDISARHRMMNYDNPRPWFNLWGSDQGWYGRVADLDDYSWEDWLADFLKSNMVLYTSASLSNLTEEVSAQYEPDSVITNTPLPQYEDIISEGDTSSAESSIESGSTAFEDFTDDLRSRIGDSGDDEIVVIPEFSVGGIHVREYRARLGTVITPVCKRIMSFIWRVALFAALFELASAEWAFYANLGRNWTFAGGFHEKVGG